ncbi:MAG TPA: hotdog fold thioesterase [Acidimicrobiia bacterium]|nr:hotdog fold thioesterase [Acidimicrobiia bacterium]
MSPENIGDAWSGHLGISFSTTDEDATLLTMSLGPQHLNFLDGAHGGALFSLAEKAVRHVASHDGSDPTLIDAHLALTAGGEEGDTLQARVEPVNVGRTLGVYRVTVTRGDGRVVCTLTGTVRFAR